MTLYAQVIVDIPARQTNRPFTYELPQEMHEFARIGSRVSVPFAGRVLQGVIIDFADQTELDTAKIRSVRELLELQPALTEELVRLSKWLSDSYFCPRIVSLHAMLPKAMKAKYDHMLHLDEQICNQQLFLAAEEEQLVDWIRRRKKPTILGLLKAFPHAGDTLKRLIATGIVSEWPIVKSKLNVRHERWLRCLYDTSQLQAKMATLDRRAVRQRQVLAFFCENAEPVAFSEMERQIGVSRTVVQTLVESGVLEWMDVETFRDPYGHTEFGNDMRLPLNEEQSAAFLTVCKHLDTYACKTILLHGITGSGKTELYLQWIDHCIISGREAIVLVPEISLTPQMVQRFKQRFGAEVAVLHSRLSDGERFDEWRKIRNGHVKVAVGARSAVFAPFSNLGLIVIDEEHESSYKQEESPKYVTRDVAKVRCEAQKAVLLLGSATPSLESYACAIDEKTRLVLNVRASGMALPKVTTVDMRAELQAANLSMFSRSLQAEIGDRLQRREQIILLLNRRGYSTIVLCRQCGLSMRCPHCEIALTYHRAGERMQCHYCGHEAYVPQTCNHCGSGHVRFFGTGTQRVEDELQQLFPAIRIIRMDVDTTRKKGAHERLLSAFAKQEADVLLGTQMISKGLDFPNVTLVGVINADTVLNMPDFRAAEKTFQLITQVAGRAGRADKAGTVIVQTYHPENYSVQFACNHDYQGFVEKELNNRKQLHYPPYCRLLLFTLSHEDLTLVVQAADLLGHTLRTFIQSQSNDTFVVLGPVAAPLAKLKDRYRYHCMVKYSLNISLRELVVQAAKTLEPWIREQKLQVSTDIDPQSML